MLCWAMLFTEGAGQSNGSEKVIISAILLGIQVRSVISIQFQFNQVYFNILIINSYNIHET